MRKFLIASLAILMALGLMGGAFAYFSDTETSSGNTFTAGTLDMEVHDGSPESWGNGCSGTWILPCIIPGKDQAGVDRVTNNVYLRYVGTITADHLEVQAFISLDESINQVESDTNQSSTASEMAKKLQVTSLSYNGQNLLKDYLKDVDGDSVKTLNDMTYPPEVSGLDNIKPVPGSLGTAFSMELMWIEGPDDNDFQGDMLTADISFTLNQHSSQ